MPDMYYDKDADLSLLKDKTIGIIGYGSQGHAHAQNLRDSGLKVIVAERPDSPAWKQAQEAGFQVGARLLRLLPGRAVRALSNNRLQAAVAQVLGVGMPWLP